MDPTTSSPSFHSWRHFGLDALETLKVLVFTILSAFDEKWEPYAEYYDKKINARQISLDNYPDNIIRTSANILHPAKQVPIPSLISPKPNKYKIEELKEKIDVKPGICHGMCIDYMRRVLSSEKSFDETINEVAKKFERGSTKKGYFYHFQSKSIFQAPDYTKEKRKKLIKKESIKQIVDYLNLQKDNRNLKSEELFAKTQEIYSNLLNNDIKSSTSEINSKWHARRNECLNVGYFYEPNEHHEISLNAFEKVEDGDYMIHQLEGNEGHVVCLFKRNDKYVIFDPNLGTFLFNSPQTIFDFINVTTKSLFKDAKISIAILKCVKKSDKKLKSVKDDEVSC